MPYNVLLYNILIYDTIDSLVFDAWLMSTLEMFADLLHIPMYHA